MDIDVGLSYPSPVPPPPPQPCLVGLPTEEKLREYPAGCYHRDWARDQVAEPACRAVIKRVQLVGCPVLFPSDIIARVGTLPMHPMDEVDKLIREEQLVNIDTGERLSIWRAIRPPGTDSTVAAGHYVRLPGVESIRI